MEKGKTQSSLFRPSSLLSGRDSSFDPEINYALDMQYVPVALAGCLAVIRADRSPIVSELVDHLLKMPT